MSREFNGTTQYMGFSTTGIYTGYGFSIAGWFYLDALPSSGYMVLWRSAVNNSGIHFSNRITTTGTLQGENDVTTEVTTNSIGSGKWCHAAFIATSTTSRRVVLNGNWASSGTSSTTLSGTWDQADMVMARVASAWYLDGRMAHWALWRTALSQSDVESLAGTFDGSGNQVTGGAYPTDVSAANLYAYWPLAGTASPEPDDKNNYDLTLYNTPTQGANDPTLGTVATSLPIFRHRRSFPMSVLRR